MKHSLCPVKKTHTHTHTLSLSLIKEIVRFYVPTTVFLKSQVIWDVKLYWVVYSYWHFERSYCLRLQGQVLLSLDCSILKMKPVNFLTKTVYFACQHGLKLQQAGNFSHTVVRTSNGTVWHPFFSGWEILNLRPNSSCRTTPCLLSLTYCLVYSRLFCLSRAYFFDPKAESVRDDGKRRLAVT